MKLSGRWFERSPILPPSSLHPTEEWEIRRDCIDCLVLLYCDVISLKAGCENWIIDPRRFPKIVHPKKVSLEGVKSQRPDVNISTSKTVSLYLNRA